MDLHLSLSLHARACPRLHARPSTSSDAESYAACGTRARALYERAFRTLREIMPDNKAEAVMVLEAWRDYEAAFPHE